MFRSSIRSVSSLLLARPRAMVLFLLTAWVCALPLSAQVPANASAVAKLAVNGLEQSGDSGNITVAFNGYSETLHYGPFSTPESVAAGLAALFTRDDAQYGLFAKAGANNNTDLDVVTFVLYRGQTFGGITTTLASASFTLSPFGFPTVPPAGPTVPTTPSVPVVADSGTVALTVNGVLVAQASYGDGSTPVTVADSLAAASALTANSPVTVRADGAQLYVTSVQTGASADYPYQVTVQDSTTGTAPSFSAQPAGGTLTGGASPGTGNAAQTVYQYRVGYDHAGNVVSMDDTASAVAANPAATGAPVNSVMGAWQYSYDPFNRLVGAVSSSGPYVNNQLPYLCWSYDEFGNRTHQSLSNQAFTSGFPYPCQAATGAALQDASAIFDGSASPYAGTNRIVSETLPGSSNPVTPGYDAAGNVINDGINTTYLYDAEGRICAVHGVYGMTGYQYGADGTRIGKGTITSMSCDPSVNGYTATNDYILDQSGDQMTEMVPSGKGWMEWSHTNVWADGALVATYDTAGLHFYLNDPLGSRRVQTDAAGYIEQSCRSLPYGDALQCPLSGPTEHHFTGKERDEETGLDYFGARYYNSAFGRWMSPDWSAKIEPVPYAKLDDPQTLNLYGYVGNDPLAGVDADGHEGGDPQQSTTAPPPTQTVPYPGNPSPTEVSISVGTTAAETEAASAGTGSAVIGGEVSVVAGRLLGVVGMFLFAPSMNEGPNDDCHLCAHAGSHEEHKADPEPQTSTSGSGARKGVHGNSLNTPLLTYLYRLEDRTTGNILKYGETTKPLGKGRYSQAQLGRLNARLVTEASGTKREMRKLETERIRAYEDATGSKPPLNKTYH